MSDTIVTPGEFDDYRWIVGPAAVEWLELAEAESGSLTALAGRLRKSLSAERTRLVLQQVELRRRARVKFTHAERMIFTRTSLEQATDETIAAYKAARFPSIDPVADLCCGIGGDLLALAARGPATGVDRDPIVALLAEANLVALARANNRVALGTVRVGDASEFSLSNCAAWHLDPDRRPKGRRTTRVELHEPGPEVIARLLEQRGDAAIKLAPAADVPEAWSRRAELEWISRDRECRQLVVWFGSLAHDPGRVRATVLRGTDPTPLRTLVGTSGGRPPVASRIDRFVFEPDPAVLAAGLTAAIAKEHELSAITPDVAYLTADRPVADPALACFEVMDVLPFDLKRLKQLLRERRIGRLEIKKRAVDIEPDAIRRRLELEGDESAVLILTPCEGRVLAVLTRRI